MNEDQTINNLDVQQQQKQLYRTHKNTIDAESQSLGNYEYAQVQTGPNQQQGAGLCPVCGAVLPQGADCENCRKYVKNDVCSFCGAIFDGDGAYCPECGSPRGGIVCPECHTLNEFAFWKKCGFPLTAEAKEQLEYLHHTPEFKHLQQLNGSIFSSRDISLVSC